MRSRVLNIELEFRCAACGYACRRRKATSRNYGQPKFYPIGAETIEVCLDCFNDLVRPLSGLDMWETA